MYKEQRFIIFTVEWKAKRITHKRWQRWWATEMARALKFLSYIFARVFIFLSAGTERLFSLSCMVTQYLEMRPPFLGKSMAMAVTAFTAHLDKEEAKKYSSCLLRLLFHLPGRVKNSSPGSFVLPGSVQSESHWRKKHLAAPSGQHCRRSPRSSQHDPSYCNHRGHGFWGQIQEEI